MKEKYIPTPGEEKEAEQRLTKTQRKSSEDRSARIKRMESAGVKSSLSIKNTGYNSWEDGVEAEERMIGEIDNKYINIERTLFYAEGNKPERYKYRGQITEGRLTADEAEILWKELSPYAENDSKETDAAIARELEEEEKKFKEERHTKERQRVQEGLGRLLAKIKK